LREPGDTFGLITTKHTKHTKKNRWPPKDFSGEWIVEWPNGRVKFRSLYLHGKEEGDHLCFWPNGKLSQKGQNLDGDCIGVWSDYWEDGTKFKETEYYSPGNFDVRWLTQDGRIREIETVRVGRERETKILLPENA
jgi:antitoxin component YwqK of YwqJK toxin-antitoxin module